MTLRIRGVVKAAQKAQDSLNSGIPSQEVAAFKAFVTSSLELIERLCDRGRMTPEQLPSRSRLAYSFLKGIDLDNLPMLESRIVSPKKAPIGVKNIKGKQRSILQQLSSLAASPTPKPDLFQKLLDSLTQAVAEIENICCQQQAAPADLSNSSSSIYAWMKFLSDRSHLQLHLQATRSTWQIAQAVSRKHCQELGNVTVEVTYQAGLYKYKRQGNVATLTISEGFIHANGEVLTALVTDALLGKSQERSRLINDFAGSPEYSQVLLELDSFARANRDKAQGKCYDLEELFDRLNREYFASTLVKPRLDWSQLQTYRKFGYYHPAKDRVVISSTLDDARIPQFVAEFVLYHELLHKYHGAKLVNGRRMVHTREFRRDEQQFKFYQEASRWLEKLAWNQSQVFELEQWL
ncbi:M48 family peptidase [Chroococcidiopsis sp. FACHB-1243]|uniref:M48 family peptidase n=1 Tax=Chroococcidiopsis sp. [FACHB-1243] TaxID=2692781 RepID=UPI00177FD978|nr:M48 family peptidase [Chroococcidiopsis sp. [FACHB-1243]]MBD2305664.1 M48 family peptidase [Chroococcidiopsis sp. [FACHB-1243]]